MRAALVARSLVSGIVVYLLAAACAASDQVASAIADGGSVADVLADVIATPVNDARAEPLGPEVVTERCDKRVVYVSQEYFAAVHAYPGKTAAQLALVGTLLEQAGLPDGYSHQRWTAVFVKDGSVMVLCDVVAANKTQYAIFALPR